MGLLCSFCCWLRPGPEAIDKRITAASTLAGNTAPSWRPQCRKTLKKSLKSFLGLLGSKLPLQLVQLHVTAVLDLGLGPVKVLLQLGDVSVDHLSLQPTVQPSRPALGGGGLMWLLGLALIPCQGVRHSGLLCGSVADMFTTCSVGWTACWSVLWTPMVQEHFFKKALPRLRGCSFASGGI